MDNENPDSKGKRRGDELQLTVKRVRTRVSTSLRTGMVASHHCVGITDPTDGAGISAYNPCTMVTG